EGNFGATLGLTAATGMVLLTVLHSTGNQHVLLLRSCCGWRSLGLCSAGRTAAIATITRRLLGRLLTCEFLIGEVALIDPNLHADATEGGLCLIEAVVD